MPTRSRRRLGPAALVATLIVGGLAALAVAHLTTARRNLTLARADLVVAREAAVARQEKEARAAVARADRRLASAQRTASRFPLGALRPIPLVGSPSRATRSAARAGRDATAAVRTVIDATGGLPTGGATGLDGSDLSAFHAAAVRSTEALARARAHLDDAADRIAPARGALLPWVSSPARAIGREVDRGRRQLAGAEKALALLADLTDPATEARLLVLAQDSLELRPTGGYIGSYGVLHFSHGTVRLDRYDATESLPDAVPPMDPPEGLAPALPGAWGLSNANWWPDFPTSARTAVELFRRQGGEPVDGVLAITEHVTSRVVGVVGPVAVPGYTRPVVEEGFDKRVVYEVEQKRPLDVPRKKFLTALADVLFDKVFSLPSDRLPALTKALDHSAGAGDIQLWFADERRQRQVADTVVGGRLPRSSGDFLMLVDANLTASKANLGLVKEVTYRVERRDDDRLVGRLDVRVRNGEAEDPNLNPYYNGYLRVYAPKGARLLGARPDQGDAGVARDGPYQVFAQLLDVPPLEERHVRFDYELPATVDDGDYRLTWLRQPGTPRDSFTAVLGGRTVALEGRARTVERSLRGNAVGEWLRDRWLVRRLRD